MKLLIRLLGLLLMIILLMYIYSITFKQARSTPLYPIMESENYKLETIEIK